MLGRFLFKNLKVEIRSVYKARSKSTTVENEAGPETNLNAYHDASNGKLEELSDKLEAALEDRFDQGADVSLSDGVLTVVVDEQNTYVINKQTPNRQIWLSSPISGPRRFDLVDGKWIDRGQKIELNSLLSEEISNLLKSRHDV